MKQKQINIGLLILRLTLAILMLFHGFAKINHGVDGIKEMLTGYGLPEFIAYGVFLGEFIAPLFLIFGYRTKLAAIVFAANIFAALLLVHFNDLFSLSKTGGWSVELLALYFFGAITLILTGGGKIALSVTNKWD